MDNREALEQQLKDLEAQKVVLFDSGSADQASIIRMNEEIKAVRQQLSEIQTQEIAEGITAEITSGIETFVVGDITFTLDQLVIDEDAADILRSGLKSISKAQAQKFLEEIESQKSVYESQLSNKQSLLDHVTADRDAVQNANAQLQLERDDLSEKRDAAAQLLLEAQAEIARLNSHVDDLRKEIANGSTPNNIIDITSDADLEAAAQRLKAKKEQAAAEKKAADEAARVRIYGVTQLDGTGAKFGAYRADDDTYLTFGWLEKNKYVELSGEEVERFQAEMEAAKQAEAELVPESDKPTELVEEQFRNDLPAPGLSNAHGTDELVGNEPVPESDENSTSAIVTRAEFEKLSVEVMSRLYNLELAVHGADYVDTGDAA